MEHIRCAFRALYVSEMTSSTFTWLSVLLATAIGDVCWTLYFIEAGKRHSLLAGFWSSAIILLGSYTIVEYTQDHSLFSAAVIGAFVGTVATIEWDKHRSKTDK